MAYIISKKEYQFCELIFFALKNDKITTAMPLQSPPQWTRKLKKKYCQNSFSFWLKDETDNNSNK